MKMEKQHLEDHKVGEHLLMLGDVLKLLNGISKHRFQSLSVSQEPDSKL